MSEEEKRKLAIELLLLSIRTLRQAQALAEGRGDRTEYEMLSKRIEAVSWLYEKAREG
ncbi:MAG: hypothetical protein IKW66_05250 [Clostridia bacterium]|nr:hypothetical protein [Clostridia bacterium]